MKLIGSLTSPYVRKVRIVMAEKKLDFQLTLEDVWHTASQISLKVGAPGYGFLNGANDVFSREILSLTGCTSTKGMMHCINHNLFNFSTAKRFGLFC